MRLLFTTSSESPELPDFETCIAVCCVALPSLLAWQQHSVALLSCCAQTWAGKPENWEAAQKVLLSLAAVNSQAQLGQYKGPHPCPGGGRILQASAWFRAHQLTLLM
jgi:hypothetical protein